MVSVLRTLQAEWNALVPEAQALNIRRVRALNLPLETIEYRRTKLEWLRSEIARLRTTTSLTPAADLSVFTFGVELEFVLPRAGSYAELAHLITQAGVPCRHERYNHNLSSAWKVTTDASVDSSYTSGAEIVSPILRGDDGFRQLQTVCGVLKSFGCKVNKKCGLHVHVGAGDWPLAAFKNLIRLYAAGEKAIDSFMAPSRRESANTYCKTLRYSPARLEQATTMDDIAYAIYQVPGSLSVRGAGRYCKVNVQSFWQHGTVEFRHHQGTVEADKVTNWTRLCLRMCLAAREGAAPAADFNGFFQTVKSPDAERTFFAGRAAFFQDQLDRIANRSAAAARARAQFEAAQALRVSPTELAQALSVSPTELTYMAAQDREAILQAARAEGSITGRVEPLPNTFAEVAADLQRRATTRGNY